MFTVVAMKKSSTFIDAKPKKLPYDKNQVKMKLAQFQLAGRSSFTR